MSVDNDEDIAKVIIGLSLDEAMDLIHLRGRKARVIKTDGVSHIVTMDLCMGRFNLVVEDNKVIDITMG